tara:strand:- start:1162 stop:1428 length:267 start_codon:yes stop_codon:yes gene_type:complete
MSKENEVEIYTRPGCIYCELARRLLHHEGQAYREYSISFEPERLQEMRQRTKGRTYPQVFINDESIGGFTELEALYSQSKFANVKRAQ